MARVSIVIPVLNRREVVLRAIASVLQQDFSDFEVVVVDDGSTDGTAEAVAAIMDPRVRLLRQPLRRGANAARNRGIEAATAPLLAFLDSDDQYLPEKLSTVLAMFDEQPDLVALLDSYTEMNPNKNDGRPLERINPAIDTSEAFLVALLDSSVKGRRMRKSVSGITVRRTSAIEAGLFDEKIRRRQDTDFLARLAKIGRCASTDRRLWIKYEQPDGITVTSDGYMTATIAIWRRNPEWLTDRRMRSGLARDIVRNLWATYQSNGGARRFARDVRLLTGEFGTPQFARLIGRGIAVLAGEAFSKRALLPRGGSAPTAEAPRSYASRG